MWCLFLGKDKDYSVVNAKIENLIKLLTEATI